MTDKKNCNNCDFESEEINEVPCLFCILCDEWEPTKNNKKE